jgi:8-oxo-dGTP diphosphatase
MGSAGKRIHVAVGVIRNSLGEILIARRLQNQHMGGFWEFPGGKVELTETVTQALIRELSEELDIRATKLRPLCKIVHDYTDKSVLLDVWWVDQFSGQPEGKEGQPLRWVSPPQLDPAWFPSANRAIIRAIRLPTTIAILDLPAPAEPRLLLQDDTLIRLRRSAGINDDELYYHQVSQFLSQGSHQGRGVLIDLCAPDVCAELLARHAEIRGVYANRHQLLNLSGRPAAMAEHLLLGCSCHNLQELALACALSADFAILSPVAPTPSHPGGQILGWDNFRALAQCSNIPVYAMGGLALEDLSVAQNAGARGIAGISMFISCDKKR